MAATAVAPLLGSEAALIGAVMYGAAYLGAHAGKALDDATGNAYSRAVLRLLGQEGPDVLPPDVLPRRKRPRAMIGQTPERIDEAAPLYGCEAYHGIPGIEKGDPTGAGWSDNERWLREKMAEGAIIFDIGWDTSRSRNANSAYGRELALLNAAHYPLVIPIYWPPSLPGP